MYYIDYIFKKVEESYNYNKIVSIAKYCTEEYANNIDVPSLTVLNL